MFWEKALLDILSQSCFLPCVWVGCFLSFPHTRKSPFLKRTDIRTYFIDSTWSLTHYNLKSSISMPKKAWGRTQWELSDTREEPLEMTVRFLIAVHGGRIRENRQRLKQERFRQGIKGDRVSTGNWGALLPELCYRATGREGRVTSLLECKYGWWPYTGKTGGLSVLGWDCFCTALPECSKDWAGLEVTVQSCGVYLEIHQRTGRWVSWQSFSEWAGWEKSRA